VQVILPTGDAVTAFRDAIQRLTGGSGQILFAVSGGPDSLAMLLLAASAMPERTTAATVDHQLRAEAANEARFVAAICGSLGIRHQTLVPDQPIVGNVQSGARKVRYRLLGAYAEADGCQWVATAHHADDQLETILMRIARGSGVDGLSAVRAKQGQIVRPMLGFTKSQLEAICADAGVIPVRDPSNDDADFDRVALRQWLTTTVHPFDPLRAARSAAALSEAAEALNWMTDRLFETHIAIQPDAVTVDPSGLPDALKRKVLLRALQHLEPDSAPRGETIVRTLTALEAGDQVTIGDILCKGGKSWYFCPAPPRKY
jgi:tRNA(Ile)-lysidine synthase